MVRRHLRTAARSLTALAVAVLLLAVSVYAGLRLPRVQHLSGYPAAATFTSDRPPAGFVPLTQRFISKVLGLSTDTDDVDTSARSLARSGRAPGEGVRSPRVTVSHAFTNDAFDRAYVVPGVPFTARTTTGSATRDPRESTACAPVGGTAWYRYTAVADERLLALTLGSDYALALGVFTDNRENGVQRVGCDNGPTGNAQVGFRANKGVTYYFQLTGVAGGGNLVFTLNSIGRTERVSVSSAGAQADNESFLPSLSADGRFVAFNSRASNLTSDQPRCDSTVPEVTDCAAQVFVHDRVGHATSLVSVSSSGEPANAGGNSASLSRNGRYVAFGSVATNLVRGVGGAQIYVRDRVTGVTERVSEPASSEPGGGGGFAPAISDDGRFVVFFSFASDLIDAAPPRNFLGGPPAHVYVRDRLTRTTTLVSEAHDGGYADAGTVAASTAQQARPTISADGRYAAFHSDATDLVRGDTNGRPDVFVRDLHTRRTELVSVSTAGRQGDHDSFGSSGGGRYVSDDGRHVAFWSDATNLVSNDTNDSSDFFVRDRVLRTTSRVSVTSDGAQGDAPVTALISTAGGAAISDDGRFVSFDSALELADDAPAGLQVYIRDLLHGITTIASVTSLGEPGNYHSMLPALSVGGKAVAFGSGASNFVANDNTRGCVGPLNTLDNCPDIFVHELVART